MILELLGRGIQSLYARQDLTHELHPSSSSAGRGSGRHSGLLKTTLQQNFPLGFRSLGTLDLVFPGWVSDRVVAP